MVLAFVQQVVAGCFSNPFTHVLLRSHAWQARLQHTLSSTACLHMRSAFSLFLRSDLALAASCSNCCCSSCKAHIRVSMTVGHWLHNTATTAACLAGWLAGSGCWMLPTPQASSLARKHVAGLNQASELQHVDRTVLSNTWAQRHLHVYQVHHVCRKYMWI